MAKTANQHKTEIRELISEVIMTARGIDKGIITPEPTGIKELCDELHEAAMTYGKETNAYSKDGLNCLENLTYNTGDDLRKYAMDIQLMVWYHVKPCKTIYENFKDKRGFIKPGKVNGKKWEYPN